MMAGPEVGLLRAALSPDGRTLAKAAGYPDGGLRTWDVKTGEKRFEVKKVHGGGPMCITFSPDGKTLASGGEDGVVCLWDTSTGKKGREFDAADRYPVISVAFSPDGRSIVTGDVSRIRV